MGMLGVGGAMPASDLPELLALLRDYQAGPRPGPEYIGLAQARDLIDLLMAQTADALVESGEWDDEGYTTPISWMRVEANMLTSAACAQADVGGVLHLLPRSVEAMERGEIGFGHLALMADTTRFYTIEKFDETVLLAKAREQTVTEFRKTCQHAIHALDPKAFAEAEREAREHRMLQLRPQDDGALWFRGWLEPEGASLFRAALEPLARKGGADDDRPREQRLADAMIEGLTKDHSVELVVTCTQQTLAGEPGSPAAETEWGGLLSSATVQRLACDAGQRQMTLSPQGVVLDFGRRRRRLSPQGTKAVKVRDGHCRFPRSCDRPATTSSIHHLVAWAKGGPTAVDLSVSLCGRHHWLVHGGGWQLYQDEDGKLQVIPPVPTGWPPKPLAV